MGSDGANRLTMNTTIREKVAELNGYTMIDITTTLSPFTGESSREIKGFKNDNYELIPPYELSLDAIAKAFDEHGLTYKLRKDIEDGITYYFASNEPSFYSADTAAMVLCKLFIDIRSK
jgi:hypothetical protein